jgi:CHAT domain-containing protein
MRSILLFLVLVVAGKQGLSQTFTAAFQDLKQNYQKENFEACTRLSDEFQIFSKTHKDSLAARSFSYLGEAFFQTGNIDKAIYWFELEKDLRKVLLVTSTEDYSTVLYNLSFLNLQAGHYQQALVEADQLIENNKKLYTASTDAFVSSVLNATDIYIQADRFKIAEKLLLTTIKQQTNATVNKGVLLSKLGDLYTLQSQFSKASKALAEATVILEKNQHAHEPEFLGVTINNAILHMSQGKYPEAEEAFDIVLRRITPNDNGYVATLNNQALVYQSLGQFDRAEKIFRDIRTQDSIAFGVKHPDFAITLTNLGLVYSDEAKYAQAEQTLLQALEIQKINKNTNTISYARKLNTLARSYRMAGLPGKAIPLHEEALQIFKNKLGSTSPEYATTAYNLGVAYWKTGKGGVGLKFLKSSAAIRLDKLGKDHPKTAESLQKIGEYQWEQKQLKEAHRSFGDVLNNYNNQIERTFPALTEEEKAKFYYSNIKPAIEKFNAFALDYRAVDPLVLGEVYNHQVNTKAAIMYATEKVKHAIHGSKDTVLLKEFEDWQAQKERIAKLYSQNTESRQLDSLTQQANALEKTLTRKSSTFADQFIRKRISWKEIQKGLKKNEALIETVRFTAYTPENGGSFQDKVVYAFLIVTQETTTQPDLILFENGLEMESKFLNSYRNHIQFIQDDERSYGNYFKPLADFLKKKAIHTVYFSPDGVYNQINLSTIQNPADKKFLIDEFDIRTVTNTRELVETHERKGTGQSTTLIGYPKFNLQAINDTTKEATTRTLTRGGKLTRSVRGGLLRVMRGDEGISVLPGTQKEIKQIAMLTTKPQIYLEGNASEETIKQLNSPDVLHIATHGYFLEQDDLVDRSAEGRSGYVPNPLLKAGIILAGAENFLRTGIAIDNAGNDGILTAYEALNLNLDNTSLVVLSACETGLGVVKNGEGVYGLQRALTLAGARNIIMSLWSVDDAATQELMSLFYEEKLNTDDIHQAFRTAQQKLKNNHPSPFYWGAFIMIGI